MKAITVYLLALVALVSCSDTQDPQPIKDPVYTFNVTATDNSKFAAVVTWEADGLKYSDPVNAWAYASSFEATPGHVLTITVTSNTAQNFRLTFLNEQAQTIKEVGIVSNTLYKFDHQLNY